MKRDPLKPDVIKPGSRPKTGYPVAGTQLGPRRPRAGYDVLGKLSTIRKQARRHGR